MRRLRSWSLGLAVAAADEIVGAIEGSRLPVENDELGSRQRSNRLSANLECGRQLGWKLQLHDRPATVTLWDANNNLHLCVVIHGTRSLLTHFRLPEVGFVGL